MNALLNPLTSELQSEVPLVNAPLIRVIAQIRFPQVLSIQKRNFVAPFQEAIRSQYPVLRPEQTQSVVIGPQGPSPISPQVIWRFVDVEDNWRVSLAPDFAAIETTVYQSRDSFFERFEVMIHALSEHVGPKIVDRIGIRYIDRITGDHVNNLGGLVRPEVLGIVATQAANNVQHTLSESMFSIPEISAQLLARWGLLPKGGTVDPAAIEPSPENSWILDLDMFRNESRPFVPDEVVDDIRSYAERIYTFFRWAVTDDFIRLYGGNV